MEAGLLEPGDTLTWTRPKLGESYTATILDNGAIQLPNGQSFASPSRAAMEAAGVSSYDGWWAWKVDRLGGELLKNVRDRFITANSSNTDSSSA